MNKLRALRHACLALAFSLPLAFNAALAQGQPPAQRAGKPWRVLLLAPGAPGDAVVARLAANGYVDGQNLQLRRLLLDPQAGPALAAMAQAGDVFDAAVAVTNPGVRIVRQAFPQLPVVGWTHDALRSGLVASMARPQGLVTGMDSRAPDYVTKRIDLLKLLVPAARRLAVVYGPADETSAYHLQALREAVAGRGLTLVPMEVRSRQDVERLFPAAEPKPADAALIITDFGTSPYIPLIVSRARERQLPSLCEFKRFVISSGCTVSHGSTFTEMAEVVSRQLDRLFRGARVEDIPMEYASRFELVVHAGQLKALGLPLSNELRLRADEVLE